MAGARAHAAAVRQIGVLEGRAAADGDAQANLAAFLQALQQLGCVGGRNAPIDIRWGAGTDYLTHPAGVPDTIRKHPAELAASTPDVILSSAQRP